MGNLPCCFYANFNVCWDGEILQDSRQMVKDGTIPVPAARLFVAGLLERHANRLGKWSMTETVSLERVLVQYFKGVGLTTTEEFLTVVEQTIIALDHT
jgi:hypothetical protein